MSALVVFLVRIRSTAYSFYHFELKMLAYVSHGFYMCISIQNFQFQILSATLTPLKIFLGHNSKRVILKAYFFYTFGITIKFSVE